MSDQLRRAIDDYLDAQRTFLRAFADHLDATRTPAPAPSAPAPAERPRRYTVKEAAAETGRHAKTVGLALQAGELHGFQKAKNTRWSIQAECLDAWVQGCLCEHKQKFTSSRGPR